MSCTTCTTCHKTSSARWCAFTVSVAVSLRGASVCVCGGGIDFQHKNMYITALKRSLLYFFSSSSLLSRRRRRPTVACALCEELSVLIFYAYWRFNWKLRFAPKMCISLTSLEIFTVLRLRYWARIVKSLLTTWCNIFFCLLLRELQLWPRMGQFSDHNFLFRARDMNLNETRIAWAPLEKWSAKKCILRKWRRREVETLLLFFFMRPMSLMLDAISRFCFSLLVFLFDSQSWNVTKADLWRGRWNA